MCRRVDGRCEVVGARGVLLAGEWIKEAEADTVLQVTVRRGKQVVMGHSAVVGGIEKRILEDLVVDSNVNRAVDHGRLHCLLCGGGVVKLGHHVRDGTLIAFHDPSKIVDAT